MKTLAKNLFVLTILIGSYSCDSSEDPTPIIDSAAPDVSISYNYTDEAELVFKLVYGPVSTDTEIIFSKSNLKSTLIPTDTITISKGESKANKKIGSTTTYTNYRIIKINDKSISNGYSFITQECVDPNLTKYLNAKVSKIEIIRIYGGIEYLLKTNKGDFSVISYDTIDDSEFVIEQLRMDKFIDKVILSIDNYTDTSKRINFSDITSYIRYTN